MLFLDTGKLGLFQMITPGPVQNSSQIFDEG
jgi:hypothetical protein